MTFKHKLSRRLTLLRDAMFLALLLAGACEKPISQATAPGGAVARVEVMPATATVTQGHAVQLTATPKDANGNPLSLPITWSTTNASVATVSTSGLVTGVAVGSDTIKAMSEGQSGNAAITVSASAPPPYGATEPPYIPGVSTLILFENFELYNQFADLKTMGNMWGISPDPNSAAALGSRAYPGTFLAPPGGAEGTNYYETVHVGNGSGQLLFKAFSAAPVTTSVVVQWYERQRTPPSTAIYNGKVFNVQPVNKSTYGRLLFENYGPQSGGVIRPLMPAVLFACFWNYPIDNGGRRADIPPSFATGTGFPVWTHDTFGAPYLNNYPNTVDGVKPAFLAFMQNMNWGTGPGQWRIQNTADGNWHRYTAKFSQGLPTTPGYGGILGWGFARVEVWADGVKIMEYIGDDNTRCEYGNVFVASLQATLNGQSLIGEVDPGGPAAFDWGAQQANVDYDAIRIWGP